MNNASSLTIGVIIVVARPFSHMSLFVISIYLLHTLHTQPLVAGQSVHIHYGVVSSLISCVSNVKHVKSN